MDSSHTIKLLIYDLTSATRAKLFKRFGAFWRVISQQPNIPPDFLDTKVSSLPNLPTDLAESAKQYDIEVAALRRNQIYCTQVLITLSYRCEFHREFVDALPDCILRDTNLGYGTLSRIQQPFEICQDNAPFRKQVEKAVDILRTYQMLALIEGD